MGGNGVTLSICIYVSGLHLHLKRSTMITSFLLPFFCRTGAAVESGGSELKGHFGPQNKSNQLESYGAGLGSYKTLLRETADLGYNSVWVCHNEKPPFR